MVYKKIILIIFCALFISKISAQQLSSRTIFKELVQKQVKWYPLTFDDWEKNTVQYFGYYLQLKIEGNRVIEANFPIDTPPIVVQRNEGLVEKLNKVLTDEKISGISDGHHVFPVICEVITIPDKSLTNNLESELKRIIPGSIFTDQEKVMVFQPILFKIYPPKR